MGLYDRDYYREDGRGPALPLPQTVVGWLILINVLAFVADGLLTSDDHRITRALTLHSSDLARPWLWWRFVSYGFAHDVWPNIWHILGNMLGLFFLGREIEQLYGRREFLRLYLALIILSGLVWALVGMATGAVGSVLGASGAVVGIVVLYALNFPRRMLLVWGIIPVPAWLLGAFIVLSDLRGAMSPVVPGNGSEVAYGVHLAGAAVAFLYFQTGWKFSRLGERWRSVSTLVKSKPVLRVHDPEQKQRELGEEVDRILEKIHREGESSLSRRERHVLETASREYQRRRRSDAL